jgi:hypothetical protein
MQTTHAYKMSTSLVLDIAITRIPAFVACYCWSVCCTPSLQFGSKTGSMSGKGAKGLAGKGAKGTMGDKKGDKKKPISRSARAGLQFPVGRIHRLLKVRRTSTL